MPAVIVMPVHARRLEDGAAAMAPFRSLATPLADMVGPMPYPAMYQLTAEGGEPGPGVVRSFMPDGLDDDAIDTIVARAAPARRARSPRCGCSAVPWPACRPTRPRSPIATRRVLFALITSFQDPAEAPIHEAWTQAYFEAIAAKGTRRLLELPRGRGRGPPARGVPGGDVRAARRGQARRRPDEPVPRNHNIAPAPPVAKRRFGSL